MRSVAGASSPGQVIQTGPLPTSAKTPMKEVTTPPIALLRQGRRRIAVARMAVKKVLWFA
ncbi:hypothetical protein [Comamonas sp.]|uniref:hypothetical protein n=1 Tax=Comamonas sp. TaxID=34028 RepID=UPI0028A60B89|nr:hypothetical protein [Comamonas sp.]